ncbi:SDR family NAD(P)-dependent oxidoreductase [Acetobacteraceae bacterium]|nr:SDR family NAD(P)-dependent oxidoreductase [Acetobacteraceae bacterium]
MTQSHKILIVGASRGLGSAMAEEFIKKGYHVIGTVRDKSVSTPLAKLAKKYPSELSVEEVDINKADQVSALYHKLQDQKLDILFVNAGILPDRTSKFSEINEADFTHAMLNNALNPVRFVDKFENLVKENGLIGVMTSRVGSIADNESGGKPIYRSSKTALNQLMMNFSHEYPDRACVLMHPGWVRTSMGGENAPFEIQDSVIPMTKTLISLEGKKGIRFINYKGDVLPW